MNRHSVTFLLLAVLSFFIGSLAAQYNPNYRLIERKQFSSGSGGTPIETNLYHYPSPTATYPDSIYNSISYGTDIITEIDFNEQGLKQEMRSYSELSPDWGSVYHIDYDASGHPLLSYTGSFHWSYPNTVQTRNHYSYSEGKLSQILHWEHFYPEQPRYSKWVLSYNDEGNPIEALCMVSSDSINFSLLDVIGRKAWTFSEDRNGDVMATLDSWADETYPAIMHPLQPSHQPDIELIQQGLYPDWYSNSQKEYSYDELNRLTGISTSLNSGGSWVLGNTELFTYDANGNLHYHYRNNQGDIDEYVWENIYPQGIVNPEITQPDLEIAVYPLPFAEQIKIAVKSELAGPSHVEIYNLRGQQLISWHALPGEQMAWDGKDKKGVNCPSGIYLIKAEQGTRSITKRIIRQK